MTLSITALLLYEYAITLGEERRLIWANIRTTYAAIFMANRLNMLCMCISMVFAVCPWRNTMVRISELHTTESSQMRRGMMQVSSACAISDTNPCEAAGRSSSFGNVSVPQHCCYGLVRMTANFRPRTCFEYERSDVHISRLCYQQPLVFTRRLYRSSRASPCRS